MRHILDKYLTTPLPGLTPQCWRFLAEHITYHRHMLIGVSTASVRGLNVPDSIREPFNVAISELEKAAELFQEATTQTNTDDASLRISRAYTALKAACDIKNAYQMPAR